MSDDTPTPWSQNDPRIHYTPQQLYLFWARVDRSGGRDACWLHDRPRSNGYAQLNLRSKLTGRYVCQAAHRVAYILYHDAMPPPERPIIMHGVGCPRNCCNPQHLTAGTHSENAKQAHAEGRYRKGKTGPCGCATLAHAIRFYTHHDRTVPGGALPDILALTARTINQHPHTRSQLLALLSPPSVPARLACAA